VLAGCGFGFIIIDCEHGSFNYAQVAALIAVARGARLAVIVRLPDNSRANVLKYMDMGAEGLLLPMTDEAEDILKVVEMAKYPPLGQRGISTTRAHNNYSGKDFTAYMECANRETLIFAQIETRRGLQNLDAICAAEGVAGVLIGPNDLSMDMGVFGNLDAPEMREAIAAVARAAAHADKPWGVISSNVGFLRACAGMGMRVASCSSELGMIHKAGSELTRALFAE
jgi:2-dehydro-3-deoxyglucarate aldolase/4-hydroxy-2-oxoheptanedioate aldolase